MTVQRELAISTGVGVGAQTGKLIQTSRGKGRVVARAPSGNSPSAVLRLRGITSDDATHGAQEGDFRPRYPPEMAGSWLEAVSLDHATQGYNALEAMRRSQPCHMRGTPLVTGLQQKWTLHHLEQADTPKTDAAGGEGLSVLCSGSGRNRFLECNAGNNVFGGHYHVREPESQQLRMSLAEYAQCAQHWRDRQLFLKANIMLHNGCSSADMGKQPVRAQLEMADSLPISLRSDLDGGIEWVWLHSLLHAQRHGPVTRLELQSGPPNGLLPARYEGCDRIFAQLSGRRRVLLLPPQQAFRGIYPYPLHHPYDRYSMVDFDNVDSGMWPSAKDIRGRVCILKPGDLLFVPQFWFAHVHFLDTENVDLTFSLSPGARIRSPNCIPLQISRLIEERVAAAEGVKDVRHWLSLIGRDEEDAWIDDETVRGYQRICMCEGIRHEIAANLGERASVCSELLLGMICERLMPTSWLDKDFREPLYLTDKTIRIEDTRSSEERKYPELFRKKLEGEGWKVPKSVSTVPIPGYNMPQNADYRNI